MRASEETLDPQDWEEFRTLAHQMVDDTIEYHRNIRELPVWQPIPDGVSRRLGAPLPVTGTSEREVYREFRELIQPYPLGNLHPRFWGWVMGNGTPLGALAEMLAAGMNPNLGGADHAANLVERQVVDWCKDMLGYPREASGLLLSGGSMANLTGLTVARSAKAGYDVRKEGVGSSPRRMVMYGSEEMHSSVSRAVDILGLGSNALRRIPVDEDFEIRVDRLRSKIKSDLKAGLKPLCIIGTAGTTNTGSIDPLDELAELAAEYGLWFHVDGAFGALAYLSKKLRPRLRGMNRADSLAFDLHKWGYLPFEAACVLVKDAQAHRGAFAVEVEYLEHASRGTAAGPIWYSDYGIQLTRGFRALKVWMAFKSHGIAKLGRMIQQNVDQASYLKSLVLESRDFELVAPVALNVVCFRFKPKGRRKAELDEINQELLLRLQEAGVAVPSGTFVAGRYAIRCAITNHRSTREDFDVLIREARRIGREILAES